MKNFVFGEKFEMKNSDINVNCSSIVLGFLRKVSQGTGHYFVCSLKIYERNKGKRETEGAILMDVSAFTVITLVVLYFSTSFLPR